MLMLLFSVSNDLYALDSSQVVEVIPRVILRKIYHAPFYVAGLFNYRGTIVPVIDLCHLIQNKPSCPYLSTRIIMVSYWSKNKTKRCLGLMAERVTETLNKPDTSVIDIGEQIDPDHPYLGGMIMDEKGMIQHIRLEYLLSDAQHQDVLAAGESI